MGLKLTNGLKSASEYNAGGIAKIWLLGIGDFINYKFSNDSLYNTHYVDAINRTEPFIELGQVDEAYISESFSNGIYSQELSTFVHTLSAHQKSVLLKTSQIRCLVVVRTYQGQYLTFGSDGGTLLTHNAMSGQEGEVHGYAIKMEKKSIYPIFEVNPATMVVETPQSRF